MSSTHTRWAFRAVSLFLCLFFWASGCSALPATLVRESNTKQPQALHARESALKLPSVVYRGDGRDPSRIKEAGGFLPHSQYPPLSELAFSVYNHVLDIIVDQNTRERNTIYVSTSSVFGIAAMFASNRTGGGWLYDISAAPNMISVEGTLLEESPFPEESEYAAIGGINWSQVAGWMFLSENYTDMEWSRDEPHSEAEFFSLSYRYVRNPDYESRWDRYTASVGQPQLAGFYGKKSDCNSKKPWMDYPLEVPSRLIKYAHQFMRPLAEVMGTDHFFRLF
ncbi:putative enterotoxin [Cordyceps sp. RAO-2017]|nr:putative enterotoxin [Cordyceps sp. RAO-2017]